LFEIKAENDQIFINGATTDDLEVIDNLTYSALNAVGSINLDSNVVSQQYILSKSEFN